MIGYARVSTIGQTLEAQIDQLTMAGCTIIFREKMTGGRADRLELRKAVAALGAGDVLIVTRLDRLARSSRDLQNLAHEIEQKGAGLRSLGDPWADTTTPHGRLFFTIMAGLAEFERSLILQRTAEGRARTTKPLGRRPLLTREQQQEARRYAAEGMTHAAIGKRLRVSRSTISRFLARQLG